jgi:hypothetical protein
VDVCSAISADMANAANGTYDCVHGTWTPPEPLACTPRGQLGTAPPCAALVVVGPDYDTGLNEAMIAATKAQLQIAYSPSAYKPGSAALAGPTLFYSWGERQRHRA